MSALTFGSLFSGVGGFDKGLEDAGMVCKWQVEFDKQCQRVLRHHWPDTEMYSDVREFTNGTPVDLICGGFPCQDLSVAGKRSGLDGERSGLWFEFRRVVSELRPTWVLIENVPGLLSSNEGRDMATVLRGLEELRYGWAYRVLNSQHFGVAQRRRRVFIVGHLGGTGAAEILFDAASLQRHPPARSEARARIAEGTLSRALSRVGGGDDPGANKGAPIVTETQSGHVQVVNAASGFSKYKEAEAATALRAVQHKGTDVDLIVAAPRVERLGKGGFTDPVNDNIIAFNCQQDPVSGPIARAAVGGSDQAVIFTQGQLARGEGGQSPSTVAAGTLRAEMGDQAPCVYGFNGDQSEKTRSMGESLDESPTLRSGGATHVAFGVRTAQTSANGLGVAKEAAHTIDSAPQAVAFAENQRGELFTTDVTNALAGQGGKPGQGYPAALDNQRPRRLTPRECERLQGFPDDWTLVEGMADGPRYRMMGNAVTVNVALWIGKRLMEYHNNVHS